MKVKAPEGLICPREDKPREYITADKAVEVPDTPYYRRLVAEGSLVDECAEEEPLPAAAPVENVDDPPATGEKPRRTKA